MSKYLHGSLTGCLLFLGLTVSSHAGDLASTMKLLESGIEITIHEKLASNHLKLTRFNNLIQSVLLKLEDQEIALEITPYPTHWEIDLGKQSPPKGSTVLISTQGKPIQSGTSIVVEPGGDGRLLLHAHQAVTVGKNLRYEPQPNKNTLGYWTHPEDYPEWLFQVPKTGKYRVIIHQACSPDQAGSRAEIRVGEEILRFKVKNTGSFQQFEARKVGTLNLESVDPQSLQVLITRLAKNAAMDLRLIELIPIH